ncbi:MAG: DEAD/DEAH box helicase, partial [Proteobacteria bacterium]
MKAKAEQKANDIAAELLELYAKREIQQGNSIPLPTEYSDFAASFGYEPTVDQQNSFDEIIKDLALIRPMDRLVCGDVGFGKTEVAMRAAFIAAMNGYQVAILAPTTLLTEQLYQNLVNRFAGFPVSIGEISRFKTRKEINQTLTLLADGKLDIVVGTHRLIQDDVKFAKLGLVIIDE